MDVPAARVYCYIVSYYTYCARELFPTKVQHTRARSWRGTGGRADDVRRRAPHIVRLSGRLGVF